MSVGVEVDGYLGAVEIDISEGNLAWVLGTGGGDCLAKDGYRWLLRRHGQGCTSGDAVKRDSRWLCLVPAGMEFPSQEVGGDAWEILGKFNA